MAICAIATISVHAVGTDARATAELRERRSAGSAIVPNGPSRARFRYLGGSHEPVWRHRAGESLTLEQVLADARGDAQVLRRRGHGRDAELIEALCDQVAGAAEDYLRWISEEDAMLRSARSTEWLRGQFPEWERAGHARRVNGKRQYRQVIVPMRANVTAAAAAGRAAARST